MIKKTSLFLAMFFVFLLMSQDALATFEFFDGKLRIRGRLEQYMVMLTNLPSGDHYYRRADRLALNQSIFTMEALTNLVDNGDWLINLQTYLRYYYDSAVDMDHRLQRSFDRRVRYRKYQRNAYDEDDWINEFYLDMYKGPWNIRLGKQVVVWSEVEMVQTIDKINPIDLRYGTPGMQPFDELKLSLWMFRGFYNSNLPGNLIFEHIFNPGDFERSRTPFEGCWMSRVPAPGKVPKNHAMGNVVYWMMDEAMPGFSLKNYQYAFRVRGNSEVWMFNTPYIIDWTLSYWNGLDSGHAVFDEPDLFNEFGNAYATKYRLNNLPGPHLPDRAFAKWKRYEAVAAIRDPNPVIFLENEMLYGHTGEVPKLDDYVIPIGKAKIVRTGGHVTLISWSNGMSYALKAADELAKEGIEAEVIDLRTLRPMDTETIVASVKKTGRAVTVEEGWQQSGVGAEIAARIMEHAFDYLDAPVARVSGKDVPMPYAANLEKLALPTVADVVAAAKAVSYR